MGKSPSFQFYPADYLADMQVQMMTLEEEGIYIRLLAYCWREGSIPSDLKALSRLCKGASEESLILVRDLFVSMPNDERRLTHKRLDEEREKQENWRQKSIEAGRNSGKSRRQKKLHTEPTFANGSNQTRTKCEPNTNSSSSSSSSSSNTKNTTPNTFGFELPDGISQELWSDFAEMRKKIRAPLTKGAVKGILADLQKLRLQGQDPAECLQQSVTRSWRGVFPVDRGKSETVKRDIPTQTAHDSAASYAEEQERIGYEMWRGMNEAYRAKNPWGGKVFDASP